LTLYESSGEVTLDTEHEQYEESLVFVEKVRWRQQTQNLPGIYGTKLNLFVARGMLKRKAIPKYYIFVGGIVVRFRPFS
jgi:hypothetical protein